MNYGIFLILGNAGSISSTVSPKLSLSQRRLATGEPTGWLLSHKASTASVATSVATIT